MEKIADVLARKYPQFNTVVAECLVSDALYQMCSENVDFLIVFEGDKFQGILTEHDIASKVLLDNRPLNQISVKEFMSQTIPISTPDASIEYCMQLMERYNVRHLAIFDRFTFMGIVSSSDLMQQALKSRKQSKDEVQEVRRGYPWIY
jgi:CBS domain-containing protein